MIEGGFYLKARRTRESAISKAPPHVREIWDWILMNANFTDRPNLKRGQLITSYDKMIDDLSWYVGFRKESYKKHHCETAMKLLVKLTMITTTRTARGMVITVCNYDKYQEPKSYENHSETATRTTREPHENRTITEEGKNGKNDKKETTRNGTSLNLDALPLAIDREVIAAFIEHRKVIKKPLTQYALKLLCNDALKCQTLHGVDPNEALKHCLSNGWQGCNPRYFENRPNNSQRGSLKGPCERCAARKYGNCDNKTPEERAACTFFEEEQRVTA